MRAEDAMSAFAECGSQCSTALAAAIQQYVQDYFLCLQIMLVLTQRRERPEVPDLDTLPGQPLPGIEEYIMLMQVGSALSSGSAPALAFVPSCICPLL